MDIEEGYVDFLSYRTYYRIVGKNEPGIPLLLLHGGPGSTHNSLELLDEISLLAHRPVISYDQLGCGKSFVEGSHKELYQKSVWVKELINLREKLGLDDLYILGHSWGGMLAIIYATEENPQGVHGYILSSTLSSASLWDRETHRLVRYLSKEDQEAIETAERNNDFTSLEFRLANEHYCRMTVSDYDKTSPQIPKCLTRDVVFGIEAYQTAWGPSEFKPLGNLRDYEYTSKLDRIKAPVLLLSGTDDESTPLQNKVMYDSLVNARVRKWHLFSPARHRTYFEKREEYQKTVAEFLEEIEMKS